MSYIRPTPSPKGEKIFPTGAVVDFQLIAFPNPKHPFGEIVDGICAGAVDLQVNGRTLQRVLVYAGATLTRGGFTLLFLDACEFAMRHYMATNRGLTA